MSITSILFNHYHAFFEIFAQVSFGREWKMCPKFKFQSCLKKRVCLPFVMYCYVFSKASDIVSSVFWPLKTNDFSYESIARLQIIIKIR